MTEKSAQKNWRASGAVFRGSKRDGGRVCEALARLTDPGVAAPWAQARETVNSYLVVRRTETGRFKAHTITHGHPKAYPMAPFGPRHPHTHSWELCGDAGLLRGRCDSKAFLSERIPPLPRG